MGDPKPRRTSGAGAVPPPSPRSAARTEGRDVRDHAWRMQQLALLRREYRSLLDQMEAAIERLESGTYGNCQSCGRPIDMSRLEAYPAATLCVACKFRNEY